MREALGVVWTVEELQSSERRDYRAMAFVGRLGSLWGMVRIRCRTRRCDCWVQDDAAPKLFAEQAQAGSVMPGLIWCSEMLLERLATQTPNRFGLEPETSAKRTRKRRRGYRDQVERKAAFDVLHAGETHSGLGRLLGVSLSTVSRISSGKTQITDVVWAKIRKMQEG